MIMDKEARDLVARLATALAPLSKTVGTQDEHNAPDELLAAPVQVTHRMHRATTSLIAEAKAAVADADESKGAF